MTTEQQTEQQPEGQGQGEASAVEQVPSTSASPSPVIYAGASADRIEAVRRAVSAETARVHRVFSTPFNGPERD